MKFYHNPTLDIILLRADDVITTSGGNDEPTFLNIVGGPVADVDMKINNGDFQ